ncbi:tumor necrosis factor b (TNF superfamily, member 2) [Dunckerocampus dactyliophorus]|uniref:tumor necrosis factor b (TNF superfamily, member 2) n=1 Tax=Dunckerocampus dactyliophorus TaxID=161453 RepID=UPI0024071FF6|nr:tumor necrosis factor b (TNF superfamily, member 2) [Dunckerocampus dactyliophorus]
MVMYTSPPADPEAGLEEKTVVVVEKRSFAGWMWKLSAGLLVAALCLGLVLLFAWYWHGRSEPMTPAGPTQALVEDPEDKTDPHDTLLRISSKAKAAIHLEGIHTGGQSMPEQLEWRNGQGQAFAQGGLRLLNNQIAVPHTGLYFVYSQASFRVSCSEEEAEENEMASKNFMPLSHRIWRYSDSVGRKASLMSAVRSACQQGGSAENDHRAKQGWYNALYLGAVFQLNKGDRLWTETNQLSELETDGGKTFFGVFAL